MSIAGIIIGILLFGAAVLWILRELRKAPLYPDDYDRYDEEGGHQS